MHKFGIIRLMFVGRGLVLLLLIGALMMPGYDRERGDARVVILVDQSDRLAPESVARIKTRLTAELEPFSARLDVTVVEFGNAVTVAEALQEALWQLEPHYNNSVVLVSDGLWSPDVYTLLEQTSEAGVPVYWLPSASDRIRPRITSIDAPPYARPGQRIHVFVDVELPKTGNYVVEAYANDEPIGRRPMDASGRMTVSASAPSSGAIRLDAELIDLDTGRSLEYLYTGALVNVVSAPRLLVIANGYSPMAASLVAGGWSITQLSPKEFARRDTPIFQFGALILDDIAATDMAEADWVEIADAVQREAVGLLVLGGPNSFGLGAYRESTLEQLLPVISEPPMDESPVSVIFLVDISGSMGRQTGGAEGLRSARDAVIFTAAALRPADRVGLITFDVDARQLLAPRARDDHADAVRKIWPQQASGGTSITAALDLAQSALAQESTEQKLLLLVTDGMLSTTELDDLQTRLNATEFEFIAMIVSDRSTDTPFTRVELSDHASLLVIDDVLRLPVLMRNEVETLRASVVNGRTTPVELAALSFTATAFNWPQLDTYLVTRARPEAAVILAGENGEPLFAEWNAGTGRVVTLTGGLNQWASDWLEWPQWPEFATGLVNYIAVADSALARPIIDRESSNRLSITVNTRDAQNMPDALRARLVPPVGSAVDVILVPEAPGSYSASVSADQEGQYTLAWEDYKGIYRHSFASRTDSNRSFKGETLARRYVSDGLLQEWNEKSAAKLVRPVAVKSLLIALAFALLLATIVAERVPISRLRSLRFRI